MKKGILFSIISITLLLSSCRHSEYIIEETEVITDLGTGVGTVTWTKDKSYLISGFVFVNDGQVLTIEAGTVIRARTGQGSLSSALIVARGGKIIARGSSAEPIIFTVEDDDLEGSVPTEARGLWGGLIILGRAPINTKSGEAMIEGIPISEPRGIYGGLEEEDNSGILQYVSIRHGGTNIGEGNEINGLTLGGVGNRTTIDHVEVIANEDDGVEIFGGTVNCSNLVVSYCGDDAFDFDMGYRGFCQFLLAINSSSSDKGIECSGGEQAIPILDENFPILQNLTLIGYRDHESALIDFDSYGAGHIRNSLFVHSGSGIAVSNESLGDAYTMFENGALSLDNNEYYNLANSDLSIYCYNNAGDAFPMENQVLEDSLSSWNNIQSNPLNISSGNINILPQYTVFDHMAAYSDSWFEAVPYKGAFGSENWIEGWTLLSQELFGN